MHLSKLKFLLRGGNREDPVELNIPLVEPFLNLASAPGAADITLFPDIKPPKVVDVLFKFGGGVRLPDAKPIGPGDAVTVPRAP